ncbi:MAG: 16S rRNA (guanine(527)-N(7))-methyltransferase RsmG [Chloroflexi bacterium]|nr:MAG: 16S rRNA (guanine(527)-N(7))-methyltransferase RsmG [Chloroflexota bacterium]
MELLRDVVAAWGITLAHAQLEMFQTYYDELVEWNRRVNLTAVTDYEEVQVRHFADSLAVLLAVDVGNGQGRVSLVDIGSGAGFPGLPLKIARPAWRVVLVESTRKKTEFLAHIIDQLGLEDVAVAWGRAEDIGRDAAYREQFDIAVARAVADMAVLAEYALPLLRIGGRFIAQKGTDPGDELKAAGKAIALLGGVHRHTIPYGLPAFDEPLHLVVIEKVTPTPEKYPRRPGVPAKRPIG